MSFNKPALFGAATKKVGVCRIGNEKEFYPIDATEEAVLDQQIAEAAKHFAVLTEAQPVGELSFAVIKKLDDIIDTNSGEKKEKELRKQSLKDTLVFFGNFSADEAAKMAEEVVDNGESLAVVKQRHTPEELVFLVGDKVYTAEELDKADLNGSDVKVAIRRGDVTVKELQIPSVVSASVTAAPFATSAAPADSLYSALPKGALDIEVDSAGKYVYRVLFRDKIKDSKLKPLTRASVKKLIEDDDNLDESNFGYYLVCWRMDKSGNLVCYPDKTAPNSRKDFVK